MNLIDIISISVALVGVSLGRSDFVSLYGFRSLRVMEIISVTFNMPVFATIDKAANDLITQTVLMIFCGALLAHIGMHIFPDELESDDEHYVPIFGFQTFIAGSMQ